MLQDIKQRVNTCTYARERTYAFLCRLTKLALSEAYTTLHSFSMANKLYLSARSNFESRASRTAEDVVEASVRLYYIFSQSTTPICSGHHPMSPGCPRAYRIPCHCPHTVETWYGTRAVNYARTRPQAIIAGIPAATSELAKDIYGL